MPLRPGKVVAGLRRSEVAESPEVQRRPGPAPVGKCLGRRVFPRFPRADPGPSGANPRRPFVQTRSRRPEQAPDGTQERRGRERQSCRNVRGRFPVPHAIEARSEQLPIMPTPNVRVDDGCGAAIGGRTETLARPPASWVRAPVGGFFSPRHWFGDGDDELTGPRPLFPMSRSETAAEGTKFSKGQPGKVLREGRIRAHGPFVYAPESLPYRVGARRKEFTELSKYEEILTHNGFISIGFAATRAPESLPFLSSSPPAPRTKRAPSPSAPIRGPEMGPYCRGEGFFHGCRRNAMGRKLRGLFRPPAGGMPQRALRRTTTPATKTEIRTSTSLTTPPAPPPPPPAVRASPFVDLVLR